MYFNDRAEAGNILAAELSGYAGDKVSVLAIGYGGYVVGKQIAQLLNCPISILYTEPIKVPGDGSTILGEVDQSGELTYNSGLSSGQLEEFITEFHNYIDQERIRLVHQLNNDEDSTNKVNPISLRDRKVIVVTDAAEDGAIFDATLNFLKRISTQKVIAAIPIASVKAVDRLHVLFDELHCLSVVENFVSADHYFEESLGTTGEIYLQ